MLLKESHVGPLFSRLSHDNLFKILKNLNLFDFINLALTNRFFNAIINGESPASLFAFTFDLQKFIYAQLFSTIRVALKQLEEQIIGQFNYLESLSDSFYGMPPKQLQFFLACASGNITEVTRFLNQGFEVYKNGKCIRDHNGYTPAHWAASNNHLNVLKLLQEGFPKIIHEVSKDRFTLLHVAAADGSDTIITYLLTTDINIEAIDIHNYSASTLAVIMDSQKAAALILPRQNSLTLEIMMFLINETAGHGSIEMLHYLLDIYPEFTALICNSTLVKRSFENKDKSIPLSLLNRNDFDILHIDDDFVLEAISRSTPNVVQNILHRGMIKDDNRYNLFLLHAALSAPTDLIINFLGILLEEDIVLKHINQESDGHTPLTLAISKGLQSSVELLCNSNASVHQTVRKMTPLHWAVTGRQAAIGRVLLTKGANPNSRTDCELSPYELAILNHNLEFIFIFRNEHKCVVTSNKYDSVMTKDIQLILSIEFFEKTIMRNEKDVDSAFSILLQVCIEKDALQLLAQYGYFILSGKSTSINSHSMTLLRSFFYNFSKHFRFYHRDEGTEELFNNIESGKRFPELEIASNYDYLNRIACRRLLNNILKDETLEYFNTKKRSTPIIRLCIEISNNYSHIPEVQKDLLAILEQTLHLYQTIPVGLSVLADMENTQLIRSQYMASYQKICNKYREGEHQLYIYKDLKALTNTLYRSIGLEIDHSSCSPDDLTESINSYMRVLNAFFYGSAYITLTMKIENNPILKPLAAIMREVYKYVISKKSAENSASPQEPQTNDSETTITNFNFYYDIDKFNAEASSSSSGSTSSSSTSSEEGDPQDLQTQEVCSNLLHSKTPQEHAETLNVIFNENLVSLVLGGNENLNDAAKKLIDNGALAHITDKNNLEAFCTRYPLKIQLDLAKKMYQHALIEEATNFGAIVAALEALESRRPKVQMEFILAKKGKDPEPSQITFLFYTASLRQNCSDMARIFPENPKLFTELFKAECAFLKLNNKPAIIKSRELFYKKLLSAQCIGESSQADSIFKEINKLLSSCQLNPIKNIYKKSLAQGIQSVFDKLKKPTKPQADDYRGPDAGL